MASRRSPEGNGSSGEARQGIRPRYRRAFGCVTWIYMATLAFLAVASLLLMPVWFLGGWNVFSILEGYAFFATLLFLPAIVSGAILGARTYRSENRVATRNGAAVGTIIGWLGYASVVWLEVNRDGGALLYAFFPLAAISSVLILYALFSGDRERGRKGVLAAAALAAVAGVLVLAYSGEALIIIGAVISAVAGAAAGWTGGIGYARAGGDDMIPPGATIKRREPREPRRKLR